MGNNESLLDVTPLILMAWDLGAVSWDNVTEVERNQLQFYLLKYCSLV